MMRAVLLLTLVLLTACGSRPEGPRLAAPVGVAGGPLLEELPTQTLARGQCALVLWSRTTPPHRLLLAVSAPAQARVRLGGRTLALPRTTVQGEAAYGHHQRQIYAGEGVTITVDAEFDARDGLVGGAAVPSAALTVRAADGTETIIPAAGLLACQN